MNNLLEKELLDILVCPVCKVPLNKVLPAANEKNDSDQIFSCPGCRTDYPMIDGIPCLMPPENNQNSQDTHSVKSIIQKYDTSEYAQYFRNPFSEKPKSFGERILSYLREDEFKKTFSADFPCRNKETAVDIACSSGRYTYELSERFKHAIGVDTSHTALKYALDHAKNTPGAINFLQCNALSLPFKPDTFDCVLCIELIHHIPNAFVANLIHGISVIMKPGGIFVFDLKNIKNPWVVKAYQGGSQADYPRIARSFEEIRGLLERFKLTVIKKFSAGNLGVFPVALSPVIMIIARKSL